MNKSIRSIATREKMRIILGVLNIILSVFMLLYYLNWVGKAIPSLRLESAMTWCLPFIAAAVVALISGIFTLKYHLLWAIVGPLFTGAALAYYYILMSILTRWA